MSGFFGAVSEGDCVSDVFYGTDYHSHLGTKRGGMAFFGSDGVLRRKIHNISNAQFRSKFDDDVMKLEGKSGIGVISDMEDQPLVVSGSFGSFAIATVGRINNLKEIIQQAYETGHCHFSQSDEGEPNPTEVIAMLICRQNSMLEGLKKVQQLVDGSCSILILQGEKIYAMRDRYGRTPVVLGTRAGAYAVAMESTSFPNLGYEVLRELGPGEIVEISMDDVKVLKKPGKKMKMCTFFWVYYGYPSSSYEGVNTESSRYRNGESMSEQDRDILPNIDSICGIPDSGIAHAIGYSNHIHKPYRRSFVKYTPTWPRSFMPQSQKLRNLVAKMKLIPVAEQIKGKRMLFCDDSIVRGTQLRDTVGRIFNCGAKEVHMRSACPPLLYGCKFLNFSQSRSAFDLAARRAVAKLEGTTDLTDEIIAKYLVFDSDEYRAMVEEIRKSLKLDTLKFQKLENLLDAIGLPRNKYCTYCWNGKDVKDDPDPEEDEPEQK